MAAPPQERAVDSKPYIRHHPVLGYEYAPDTVHELPRPGGGRYRLRTNAEGIRSDRTYTRARPVGVRRVLVFGDSFAAGQYVSNDQRFSELLEARRPDLEVINFGLEGTGTDQQLLLFEEVGRHYEHDALVLMPFLQNIRRNLVEARAAADPASGAMVLIPKPRFELTPQGLQLRNVPVRDERRLAPAGLGADDAIVPGRWWRRLAAQAPGAGWLKRQVGRLRPWEPFPEYADPKHPAWQLMEALIERFIAGAEGKPILLVPVFYVSYLRQQMARNYWDRFQSLARHPNVRVVDLLPPFRDLGAEAESVFLEPHDCHFSPAGHLVLANVLERELAAVGAISG
ncbi:MAG TPA: SGNH/GDSL hydrolase family protein [Gemmatales bacterium]|nr:SGNH/GDSL hydrolase family protein [Gemmatales bacterium]HMP60387.1 SGNH/GDSL hydrolase family protein [Gemmatales bacterium]